MAVFGDLGHDAAKNIGASGNDVDATGNDGCVTDRNAVGTIESVGATEQSRA